MIQRKSLIFGLLEWDLHLLRPKVIEGFIEKKKR
jgi:hypothetical protein